MVDPKQPRSQAFGSAVDVCTNGTGSFQHVATYESGVSHSHCTLSHFVTCPHVHMDLSWLIGSCSIEPSWTIHIVCWISQTGIPSIHWNSSCVQMSFPRPAVSRFPALQLGEELGRGHSLQILRRHAAWRMPGGKTKAWRIVTRTVTRTVTHLLGLPLRRFAKLNDEIWQSSFQIFKWSWFWVHGIFWTN